MDRDAMAQFIIQQMRQTNLGTTDNNNPTANLAQAPNPNPNLARANMPFPFSSLHLLETIGPKDGDSAGGSITAGMIKLARKRLQAWLDVQPIQPPFPDSRVKEYAEAALNGKIYAGSGYKFNDNNRKNTKVVVLYTEKRIGAAVSKNPKAKDLKQKVKSFAGVAQCKLIGVQHYHVAQLKQREWTRITITPAMVVDMALIYVEESKNKLPCPPRVDVNGHYWIPGQALEDDYKIDGLADELMRQHLG